MKVTKLWILGILNILFLAVSLFFVDKLIEKGNDYNHYMHEHVKVLKFQDRLLNPEEWKLLVVGKVISSVEDTVWQKKLLASEHARVLAKESYQEVERNGQYLLYFFFGLLLLTIIVYAGGDKLFLALGGSLLTASIVYLIIGIYTPMLEIHAYSENLEIPLVIKFDKMSETADEYVDAGTEYLEEFSNYMGYEIEIPKQNIAGWLDGYEYDHTIVFEGKMYYYHQSKSIKSIIELLFKDKNYAVAWAILSFSVFIPILKMILSFLLIYFPYFRTKKGFLMVLSILGKWSMADVFVAATFLAFLSFHNMNVGIETSSNALLGMNFFMGYVVLSLLASTFIWLATKKETKLKGYEMIG